MRLKSVRLKDFKRFDDLTVNLGEQPRKIIALVGPNGCGKSSIFDGFQEILTYAKRKGQRENDSFYSKLMFSETPILENYQFHQSVFLTKEDGSTGFQTFNKKSFYIRSAYRFTPKLKIDIIKAQPDITDDINRPLSSIALDTRMTQNYEQMYGAMMSAFSQGNITGDCFRNEYTEKINKIIEKILNVKISDIGDIYSGRGQLFFKKETSINFPYDNLSSGEKEVIDIIIDLVIKVREFNETVYCIDEPELHLNTTIQRKLLIEIEKLIPDTCQLWIATHSVGFLRALQEDLKDKTSILDFSEKDYFNGTTEINPIFPTRENWQRIFKTALADLTGLLAPKRIVYCEGKLQNSLDESLFNMIFQEEYPDMMFISSGNKIDVQRYSSIALNVLNKAFSDVEIIALIDRDDDLQPIKNKTGKITIIKLNRREFENYLFDKDVLKAYCESNEKSFNEALYAQNIQDIINDDVKGKINEIKKICDYEGGNKEFKYSLAEGLPRTSIYDVLKKEIGLP